MEIWSKEQAWNSGVEEKWDPIDRTMHDFRIRRNWFHHRNCCTFSTFLLDRFPADQPWKMLTIGVFEGAQEVWLMQKILQHPDSRLVGLDPWMATEKLDQTFMDECYANAKHNLSPWERQASLYRGFSQTELKDVSEFCGIAAGDWDLIIIDGDHNAEPVYQDAINCYELVRTGGWLLFDDVRNRIPKKNHVKHGLEKFFRLHPTLLKHEWSHRYCDCYSKV